MAKLKYEKAEDLGEKIADIIQTLKLTHLDPARVPCVRSRGSRSKHIVARIHALQRIVAEALGLRTVYVIEVISENFDKLDGEEQVRTLIHELLHIPRNFGGGLLGHRRHVSGRKVARIYRDYLEAKKYPQVEISLVTKRGGRSGSAGA
jgi:predicted metallopeptidase